jgi:hypothetical protein
VSCSAGTRLGWRSGCVRCCPRRTHVPAAAGLLAALGALLWAALHWHWNIAGGPAARLVIPLVIETGAAGVLAVSSHGPFGEAERATGRWLPPLRLGAALALTAVAGLAAGWGTPWIWPGRPSGDLGGALCASAVFAAGVIALTLLGTLGVGRRPASE